MGGGPTQAPGPGPEAAPLSLLGRLTVACGVIALLASFWAGATLGLLAGRQIMVLRHADGYRAAEFVVERLVFSPGRWQGSRTTQTRYWAEGSIDGRAERFGLGGYLPGIPANQAELENMIRVGQVLPVLYNPEVPDTIEARVLYPEPGFPAKWELRQRNLLQYGLGPLAVSLGLCLAFSLADRSWTGVRFAVACVPLPLFGWLAAWLDRSA